MKCKILAALDFSDMGKHVVSYGYEVAEAFGCELTFMHVVPEPSLLITNHYLSSTQSIMQSGLEEMRSVAEKKLGFFLAEESAKHEGELVKFDHVVLMGDPAQSIIEYAKCNSYNMIILGYKGYSKIEQFLVGGTANKVARYAPCSVLIYRPERTEEEEEKCPLQNAKSISHRLI